jgi:integrase
MKPGGSIPSGPRRRLPSGEPAVSEDFITQKLSRERKGPEVAQDIRRDLLPHCSKRPITEITDLDIHAIVMAKHKYAPSQARNLLGIVKRLLQWTVEQRVYGLQVNAAMLLRPRALFGKKRKRERVLSNDEMRALWRAARRENYPCGDVYKLLALCALRLGEAAGAQWQEFTRRQPVGPGSSRSGSGIRPRSLSSRASKASHSNSMSSTSSGGTPSLSASPCSASQRDRSAASAVSMSSQKRSSLRPT